MDKLSYLSHLGHSWGVQLQLEAETDHVEKVASSGGQVDEDAQMALVGLADQFEFQEAQNGVSFDEGAYSVLAKVAAAFEADDTDAEALYEEIKVAMAEIEEGMPLTGSEDDQEVMLAELIKGASVGIAEAQGADEITDEIVETATNLVVGMLSGDEA